MYDANRVLRYLRLYTVMFAYLLMLLKYIAIYNSTKSKKSAIMMSISSIFRWGFWLTKF